MAESNGQEKTEQPTGKRRSDARKEGNVFQSKDVATVAMLLCVFWMAKTMMPFIYRTIRGYMEWILSGIGGDIDSFFSARLMMITVTSFEMRASAASDCPAVRGSCAWDADALQCGV